MCSGEGIPSIPARPTRVAAAAKVFSCLLKARGLHLAFLWWRFRNYFFFSPCLSTSGPTQPRGLPRPLAPGACGCRSLCPRGGAHERQHQGFSPSAARSKYRGVCDVPTPSRAHVWEPSELCLSSPARDCYPLASLIFPNLYKCFHKFSGKLRSNLFHPVIPLRSPLRVRFIFLTVTSRIM